MRGLLPRQSGGVPPWEFLSSIEDSSTDRAFVGYSDESSGLGGEAVRPGRAWVRRLEAIVGMIGCVVLAIWLVPKVAGIGWQLALVAVYLLIFLDAAQLWFDRDGFLNLFGLTECEAYVS